MTAQQLINDGWALVPIAHGTKAATGQWNVTDYDAASITEGMAAKCGAPSGWRVCVDSDSPEAVIASELILPITRLEGRSGRPNSHAWFVCRDAKHVSYKLLGKATIIEILATGQYAILPPTRHPSGDVRMWANQKPLLEISFADLQASVRAIAVACLIAEHYPGPHARHEARLALAGFLRRSGFDDQLTRQIGRAIETIVGGDLKDWDAACSSTLAKSVTTGATTLVQHLDRGDEVIALINRWVGRRSADRVVRFTTADTITPKRVEWLWDDRIPAGHFGLLAGREGLGKSLAAVSIAAKLSRGTLEGVHFGHPKSVIIAATEDSWAHVIAPRLIAADADLTRIIRAEAETSEGEEEVSLPADLVALQQAIIERGDVGMILLDPLISRLDGKLDTHKDAEVRRALEPLVKLADATQMAVVGIIHVNKATTSDPLNSVMGSRAFSAVSRFVLFVVEDPNDHSIRLFGQPKNNLGPTNQNTLTFEVEGKTVQSPTGPINVGCVSWTGRDPRAIREILQGNQNVPPAHSKLASAITWLSTFLQHKGGYAESALVKSECKVAGFSDRHLIDARKRLNISVLQAGFPRKTLWALPGCSVPNSVSL